MGNTSSRNSVKQSLVPYIECHEDCNIADIFKHVEDIRVRKSLGSKGTNALVYLITYNTKNYALRFDSDHNGYKDTLRRWIRFDILNICPKLVFIGRFLDNEAHTQLIKKLCRESNDLSYELILKKSWCVITEAYEYDLYDYLIELTQEKNKNIEENKRK